MPLSLRESIARVRRLPSDDAVLMGRAELLGQEDRDLVETVLVKGQSAELVARLMGVPPHRLRARLHRLSRKLTSREFMDVARALPYLPCEESQLARLHFLQGLPQRLLSRQLGMSYHTLRRKLDRVSAHVELIRRIRRQAPQCIPAGETETET